MVLKTTTGAVVGEQSDGRTAFRGIRYGNLANGRRFDPVAPAAHDSVQDLRNFPAMFPQLPSRLDTLLGTACRKHPQEEDAFLLNVWMPSGAANLPVLFFIHGGGFVSGGGVIPWYSGGRLAREGDMVVVTTNYRLGPLAHLVTGPDGDDANRAVDDLLQALIWVRENIGLFGGDPGNLTVAGQSAGAFYAQILAVLPESRGLIRRLLLMSTPGIPASSRSRTESLSGEVIENLQGADPSTVPVDSLLRSHQQVMKKHVRFGSVGPTCLLPTVDARVPDWLDNPGSVAKALDVADLLVTFTHDETGAYFFNSRERDITTEQVRQLGFGRTTTTYETPYAELVARTTASLFGDYAKGLVAAAREHGIRAELREFDVPSPLDGLGSCHGFDMPFLFGNRAAWVGAHLLDGIDDDLFEAEGGKLRAAVADLVHLP
ncbi:MAG TPA: carboxylesterase family protein [Amycolatopsis sp.]|uniref:carboxylesterase family protein n=1 Tax=Amycolatopsis sp. TaxID=37632 RepID=UPI002B476009|nr:carboxylesterase family protein [Amycolatopsis sp.]HKS49822.1 carboxylesterase family protein [Amycolatopsis sp.]